MQNEIEQKSNKKIHIAFAIFTFIFSILLGFQSINASTITIENVKNSEYVFNNYFKEKIKGYTYNLENEQMIINVSSLGIQSGENTTDPGDDIYKYNCEVKYFSNGVNVVSVDDNGHYYQYNLDNKVMGKDFYINVGVNGFSNFVADSDVSRNYLTVRKTNSVVLSSIDIKDLSGKVVFRKPLLSQKAEILPVIVGEQTKVIIGSTIGCLALVIFLVILVRHLQKVSGGY